MELSICLDCPFTLWLNIIFLVVIMYGHLIVEYLIQIFELSIQAIQVGATKVLSLLLTISDYSQPYFSGNACFGFDDNQVWHLCSCSYFYISHLVQVSAVIVSFSFSWVSAWFQIADLRHSVESSLQSVEDEDLFVASVNLLTSAAHYQVCYSIFICQVLKTSFVNFIHGWRTCMFIYFGTVLFSMILFGTAS